MPVSLTGEVALVTGASSGIGRACALLLAQCGAQLVVNHFKDADRANEVVRQITEQGGAAIAVEADVSNEAAVEAMLRTTVAQFGTLHVLISNAGI